MTLDGCPIFWRTHRAAGPGPEAPAAPGRPVGPAPAAGSWRGELLREAADAIVYVEEQLGVAPPARIVVTGPPAEEQGLAAWLETHLKVPVDAVDAGRLVRPFPQALSGEDWNRWEVALGAAAHRPLTPGAGPQGGGKPVQRQDALGEEALTPRLDPAAPGIARPLPALLIPAEPPASTPGVAHGDCSVVVGNRRSKIYHVPGGRFYQRMATTSKDKVCFGSQAEAEKAGFRKSKR